MTKFHVFAGFRLDPRTPAETYAGAYPDLLTAVRSVKWDIGLIDWGVVMQENGDGALKTLCKGDLDWDTGKVTWIVP